MPILSKILGKAASQPIEAIGNVLDSLFTSKEEKLSHQEVMTRLALQPNIAQVEINKIEAQHRSVFVAGWRPCIGWACAAGIAYSFVFRDLLAWIMLLISPETPPPPMLAIEHLVPLVMTMLGMGSLRTLEKLQGKTK